MLISLALGYGRYHLAEWLRLKEINQRVEAYNGQEVELTGIVAHEPDLSADSQKLTVKVQELKVGGQGSNVNCQMSNACPEVALGDRGIKGQVLVKTGLYPRYDYGDQLQISCQLKAPEPIEDFAYDKYLQRYGIYSLCYQSKIKMLAADQGDPLLAGILQFKNYFTQRLSLVLKEPYAAFMGGLLLGAKKGLPEELATTFSRVGITHIVAVSGYNISILAVLFSQTALALGISRKKSFWLVLAGVGFFVVITGASASVVRAAVMGLIVLLAQKLGRLSQARNAITLSAVLMLAINPKILALDVGFQLSFLATLGLIYLSHPLAMVLKFVPKFLGLRESASTTLAATLMTLPLIAYQFGRLSLVALAVNLLVLPFIPLAMLVGFITGIAAMIWLPLGEVVGWASWLVLQYIIQAAEFFAHLSWASIALPEVSFWWLVVGYLVLGFTVLMANRLVVKSK